MIVVCLSDTHCHHRRVTVPDGDLLIFCGDMSNQGSGEEISGFMAWIARQPHRHKICIAGNHDSLFERAPLAAKRLLPPGVHYLEDSGATVEGLTVWGSPVTPTFLDLAFNRERGAEIGRHWNLIPDTLDILVTHAAPARVRDLAGPDGHQGCEQLRERIEAVQPLLACYGHLHEGHGYDYLGDTLCVNAAVCDEMCRPVNKPIVVEIARGKRGEFLPY